jgi:pyruvate/2-oxoglutarate dehydrogenase complex dihydrolipoamide acyltransferase (E2) component
LATAINIPKLGWSMEEGTLLEWLVDDGATVAAGQVIYRLETDKVENEIEAPIGGVLRQIGNAGEIYAVGDQIGEIE